MKNFEDFVSTIELKSSYDFRTIDEFYDKNGINEEILTDEEKTEIDKEYLRKNWNLYGLYSPHMLSRIHRLTELLKSHPSSELLKKILDKFGDDIVHYEYSYKNNISQYKVIELRLKQVNDLANDESIYTNKLLQTKKADEFYDLIELYLHNITLIQKAGKGYSIFLEPEYTEITKSNCKYAYHITTRENAIKILKSGLRPRTGKTKRFEEDIEGYRYFPERIYAILGSNTAEETKWKIKNEIKELDKTDDYAIVQIYNDKNKIDWWIDSACLDDWHVYTHTYIPKQWIKNVYYDVDEIE